MNSQGPATPPAGLGVLLLLARTAFRRKYNYYTAGLKGIWRRQKTAPAAKRQATPRKRVGSLLLMVYVAVCIVFSISNLTAMAFRNAKAVVSSPAKELPDQWTEIKAMAKQVAGNQPAAAPGRELREQLPWPSPALAPAAAHRPAFIQLQAVLLCLLALAAWLLGFAGAKQELGHGGWSLEWLATFPVPTATLLVARIIEYAVADIFLWLGYGPYLLALFIVVGKGWSAVPLAVGFTLLIGSGLAAVRVLVETALRKRVPTHALKNLQAICSLAGNVGLMGFMACLLAPWLLRFVHSGAQRLPALIGWLPPALPATACVPGRLWPSLGALALATGAITGACLWFSARLLRDGMVTNAGTFAGVRGMLKHTASSGPTGVAGKDLRLLRRDRTLLVQTLVVPLLVAGFQAILNPGGARAILANPNHLAAVAFGVGAYMLCFSAIQVLTWEGPGLWLLYTFPEKLERLLVRKVALWTGVAVVYTGVIFVGGVWWHAQVSTALIVGGGLALVGVGLHAFIAAGIGILGADPLQPDIRHRLHPSNMLSYMLLASMFAYAIYTPSNWAKVAQVVLSALLAFALWQKVRDHLPYLLDPVSAPPPRVSLSDGMIAAVTFFVLQGLLQLILLLTHALAPELAVVVAFAAAGALVAAFTLYNFWRQHVPNLLAEVGFRRRADGTGTGLLGGLGLGLVAGAVAAGAAWLYLAAVPRIPALKALAMEQKALQALADPPPVMWLALLLVVAAPLCEEYIFRGLVFRGLRRSLKPGFAIVASAAVFAIVHPPLAVVPVFGLGLACAFAFERSKTLLAPMATHALYNAVVLFILTPTFMAQVPDLPPPPAPRLVNDVARPAAPARDEVLIIPAGLGRDEKVPLVVVLHAAGESPRAALEPMRASAEAPPQSPEELRKVGRTWRCALFAPCGSLNTGTEKDDAPAFDWNAARDLDRVAKAVRDLVAEKPIQPGAVYLLGFGTGANLAYLLGIRNPELFSGVIACGGQIETEFLAAAPIARAATLVPVCSIHDRLDRAMTPEIVARTDVFLRKHRFTTRRDRREAGLPSWMSIVDAIYWIETQRATLVTGLTQETPEQATAAAAVALPADESRVVLPAGLKPAEQVPLIVFLHGAGGSPAKTVADLQPLATAWRYAVLAPCGSVKLGPQADGQPGYDWDAATAVAAVAEQVRQTIRAQPVRRELVYLMGFASGASLAYALGLKHPELFTGVLVFSGRLPRELVTAAELARAAPRLPVFIVHGTADLTTPARCAKGAAELLKQQGFAVTRRTFSGGHELPPLKDLTMMCDGVSWIQTQWVARLAQETPATAAEQVRREVPADYAVRVAERYVIATNAPAAEVDRLLADFRRVAGDCAALTGREPAAVGTPIRAYYPQTKAELTVLHRSLTGSEPGSLLGCLTWLPTRAWGSADVGGGSLTHELVHVFVMADWPELPGWLNEALAVTIGSPRVRTAVVNGQATADLILLAGWRTVAQGKWTPLRTTLANATPDYASLDTVDAELFPGCTVRVGPLLTGRLFSRWLAETGKLGPFYRAYRDHKDVAAALKAIGATDADQLDADLRAWVMGHPEETLIEKTPAPTAGGP